ncbi:dipeptidase [Acinetobacter puyangensis]|uniref:dipeptidase n=1 Tax=Acinetobacter puyangensis TaxID=1096779 RepID=UPI003A4E0ED4
MPNFKVSFNLLMISLFSSIVVTQTIAADNIKQDYAITAKKFHQENLLLDSHMDIALHLTRPDWDILKQHEFSTDFSQVDLPRLRQGGLKGGFWAVYIPQGERNSQGNVLAATQGLAVATQIQDVARHYPQDFALALNSEQVKENLKQGKFSILLSIENASPLALAPEKLLPIYHRLGLRMLGFVHFKNNDFADSSTDKPEWHGLSPAGKNLVKQANCLGIILDVSHASDDVFDQTLLLSTAPFIASHSSSKTIYDHPRNLDDERIKKLAAKGGLIQINSYGAYLANSKQSDERKVALGQLFGSAFKQPELLTQNKVQELVVQKNEIDIKFPEVNPATIDDFMQHLLHVLKLVGSKHVGIGMDWDGGGGVTDVEDVSKIVLISQRLLEQGYSEQDLKNIWGENLLRLLEDVERKSNPNCET